MAGRKYGTMWQLPHQKKLEITDIEQKSFSQTIFSSNCHTKNYFCHTKYFGSGPPLSVVWVIGVLLNKTKERPQDQSKEKQERRQQQQLTRRGEKQDDMESVCDGYNPDHITRENREERKDQCYLTGQLA